MYNPVSNDVFPLNVGVSNSYVNTFDILDCCLSVFDGFERFAEDGGRGAGAAMDLQKLGTDADVTTNGS